MFWKPGNSFSPPKYSSVYKKISYFNSVSTLRPFTPYHHASPPTQLWYLCCFLPSMNRPCPGSAFSFLHSFYTFYTLLPWKFRPFPYIQSSELFRCLLPTPSLFLPLWSLFQAPNISFNCLVSPPGLDSKQKASSFPVLNIYIPVIVIGLKF